jgi:hypothetical protein
MREWADKMAIPVMVRTLIDAKINSASPYAPHMFINCGISEEI